MSNNYRNKKVLGNMRPILNLKEYVRNRCLRTEIGYVDGKYIFRGGEYTKGEIDKLLPTELKYARLETKAIHTS